MWTLRVRHKGGSLTLKSVPEESTVAELRRRIAEELGWEDARQLVLKVGVPPTVVARILGCVAPHMS
eukprot:3893701-Amphidinium_carterae.1